MKKKSFLGLQAPKLFYETFKSIPPNPQKIPIPDEIILFHEGALVKKDNLLIKEGEKVKKGQKLSILPNDNGRYLMPPLSGVIKVIDKFVGNFGKEYISIKIGVDKEQEIDDQFAKDVVQINTDLIKNNFQCIPGKPPVMLLDNKTIDRIIIKGLDSDLLVMTNQYITRSYTDKINKGIEVLREGTGINNISLLVFKNQLSSEYKNVEIRQVDTQYPSAFPELVMKNIVGKEVPQGKKLEDLGTCVLSAESVKAIGAACEDKTIPFNKIVTVIKKDGSSVLVEAIIGTPIKDILLIQNIELKEKDRIIVGGPMTGYAIYTDEFPVLPDTDGIIIQDSNDVSLFSDNYCINCGDCIRVCPAKIQVNMLVRFLEAAQYVDAESTYDLQSCIECGLCAYVCPSKIPILQYIKIAKFELARTQELEAEND
ncbi:MAG: 4Fe-4S dicluster domain-containing protein [Desulfobacterales bacterium]|nr:4Fe-4S dicluster domain-containing protein [Desulfobacterales bacterium]